MSNKKKCKNIKDIPACTNPLLDLDIIEKKREVEELDTSLRIDLVEMFTSSFGNRLFRYRLTGFGGMLSFECLLYKSIDSFFDREKRHNIEDVITTVKPFIVEGYEYM